MRQLTQHEDDVWNLALSLKSRVLELESVIQEARDHAETTLQWMTEVHERDPGLDEVLEILQRADTPPQRSLPAQRSQETEQSQTRASE